MKKPHEYDFVSKIYSLFEWHQCIKCRMDFRRERGWCTQTGPYYLGRGRLLYLCSSCAPTKETAELLFLEFINRKPSGPPPPPIKAKARKENKK